MNRGTETMRYSRQWVWSADRLPGGDLLLDTDDEDGKAPGLARSEWGFVKPLTTPGASGLM